MRRLATLALAALALACGPSSDAAPQGSGELAPDFELARLEGGSVRLADLRGRTVLLDFWATWCAPCIVEIPELNAFHAEQGEHGVEVLGISIDTLEDAELKRWVDEHDMQYPVVRGDIGLAELYKGYEFPFHVLISPEGQILERLAPGFHSRDELRAAVGRYTAN